MSKIKNGGLDQYGAERLEQQQFGTAGVEGVNNGCVSLCTCNWPMIDICSSQSRSDVMHGHWGQEVRRKYGRNV